MMAGPGVVRGRVVVGRRWRPAMRSAHATITPARGDAGGPWRPATADELATWQPRNSKRPYITDRVWDDELYRPESAR
ncbi:hypothetical protein [Janibacter terrae]|uniref:hypothetical protein n=1 Tax=Janibacter terrae TaxID=103817 RepID=UPI00083910CF|nr:hypothetical protein [Janibacter terrae]